MKVIHRQELVIKVTLTDKELFRLLAGERVNLGEHLTSTNDDLVIQIRRDDKTINA